MYKTKIKLIRMHFYYYKVGIILIISALWMKQT